MMKKEKKLCGRVENNLKSVHLVLLKCAPSFPNTKKKGLITKTAQKKTNKSFGKRNEIASNSFAFGLLFQQRAVQIILIFYSSRPLNSNQIGLTFWVCFFLLLRLQFLNLFSSSQLQNQIQIDHQSLF